MKSRVFTSKTYNVRTFGCSLVVEVLKTEIISPCDLPGSLHEAFVSCISAQKLLETLNDVRNNYFFCGVTYFLWVLCTLSGT